MNDNFSAFLKQVKQRFELRSPSPEIRKLIFEYTLIAILIGLNPFPHLLSFSLILVGLLSLKMMRDIGRKWGYPKGQDILAIAGNLAGGLGAFVMACLVWGLEIVASIYFPVLQSFALAAAYGTFIWIVGQATHQYYATGKAREARDESQMSDSVGIASQIAGGGGSMKRRNMLYGLLAVSTFFTGLNTHIKQQEFRAEQAKLSQLARESDAYVNQYLEQAFTSDTAGTEQIQAIKAATDLLPPTVPYDREMSKLLIRCNRLGTEQYLSGTIVTDYDGSIRNLPSYDDRLNRYTRVATLRGPEEATTKRKLEIPDEGSQDTLLQPDPLRENLDQVENIVKQVGGQAITVKWLNPVYWGFVLQSPENSIIAFRGTQQTSEWIQNVLAQQVQHNDLSQFEFEGKVHRGFATLYGPIADQVIEAAQQLDSSRPIYITGHSLGASLANLAAMDVAIRLPELRNQLRLYTYAGPRVGDVAFAEAHSRLVPNNYRVVNMADSVPTAPPTSIGRLVFAHAGQAWTFVDYSGDLFLGHFVSVYKKAVDAEQEQFLDRQT
jgi:triacylglycerol lipase